MKIKTHATKLKDNIYIYTHIVYRTEKTLNPVNFVLETGN